MKKTIVIEVLLAFALAMLVVFAIMEFRACYYYLQAIEYYKEIGTDYSEIAIAVNQVTLYGTFATLAALCTLAAIIIIAIKDFPVFKPLVDKFNAKRAAYKEQREAVKAEQAEAAKQARIEQLQAEIDELKKDE